MSVSVAYELTSARRRVPLARRASRIVSVQEEMCDGPSEDDILAFIKKKLGGKVAYPKAESFCSLRLVVAMHR